jgi:hypothetical protein
MRVWWRNYADHHMRMLISPEGPFATARDQNGEEDPLAHTAPTAETKPYGAVGSVLSNTPSHSESYRLQFDKLPAVQSPVRGDTEGVLQPIHFSATGLQDPRVRTRAVHA